MSYGPPPPANPYGSTPGYGGAPHDHPKGTTVLILGILSLVCCGIFTGIPAIIMGKNALRETEAAPGVYSNVGTIKAGYICGIIGTVWSAIALVVNIIVLATSGSLLFGGN
ncbi:DUF4190 domain-containing protein [Nocardioides sp. GXZ039]|uniref:DUF4190 domain-containing protein n=1 Tax=Nocardioides sp. GXZ039 TaxID=3136018 RepID=UPI0030F44484